MRIQRPEPGKAVAGPKDMGGLYADCVQKN